MTREEKLQALAARRDPSAALFSRIQTIKGDPGTEGKQGPKGDSIVGPRGPVGPQGPAGREGKQGPAGKDGKSIIGPQGPAGKNGAEGKTPSVEEVVAAVLTDLKKGKKLTVDHVDGLSGSLAQLKEFLKVGGYRGGGDTVTAGTGVTITIDANGHKVITATGGAGNAVYGEDLTPQGPGTVYTLAHTPLAGTVRLYRGGSYQQAGVDYTISSGTITLTVTTQQGEVLLADYFY